MKNKILLHACCAPCASVPLERVEHDVTLFFFNPNVYPRKEYERRLKDTVSFAEKLGIPLIEGAYDHEDWLRTVLYLKDEKEGGKRCKLCYQIRLFETARTAKDKGFDFFGTTLTLSPHKDAFMINEIGLEAEKVYGLKYLKSDFKKMDGFKRSVELSKRHGLYRQDYCGCEFSIRSIASPKL